MQDGWITAGFNALNQPVCMWSPAYPGGPSAQWLWFGYDPLGRCVKRWKALGNGTPVTAATYYYYDGWNLVQEGPSGGTAARVYVHGRPDGRDRGEPGRRGLELPSLRCAGELHYVDGHERFDPRAIRL